MSPQEGEERSVEEYHGEKEQKELKTVEANRSVDLTIEDSFRLTHGENGSSSDCVGMQHYESPSFEEESSNKNISSPAPVVEKGGENEFVKVSHLASVQVKAVPTQSVSKMKLEKPEHSNRTRRGLQKIPEHNASLFSRSSKKKLRGSSQRRHSGNDEINSPYGEENLHNEPSLEMLVEIEKSPYEPGRCAESGESLFEEMKTLLLEEDDDDGGGDNSQAVHIFGPTNAGCLVKANSLIERSGMLYSQTWNKGSIRGDPVGIIPNHLLLMVLVPNRFAKASELLLSGLCRDLEVYESVNRGLDDWGWAEDYIMVRATKKNYKFKANKRDCFKCAVFVARAHSCFLSFGKKELEPRLIKKLKTCLDIMEDHLVTPSASGHNGHTTSSTISSAKKRKKMAPDHVLSTSSFVSHSTHASTASTLAITKNSNQLPDPPVKRKRGRPSKNSKQQLTQQTSSLMQPQCSMNEEKEPESSRSKRHHLHRVRGGSRPDNSDSCLISRRVSSSLSSPSLHELMSRFEVQYKEMGQRYAEMGTLLAQMKFAIDDRRTPSEQEIRKELLEEIQRNILESMPKR